MVYCRLMTTASLVPLGIVFLEITFSAIAFPGISGAAGQSPAAATAPSPVEVVMPVGHTEINSVILSYGDDRFAASSGFFGDHVIKLWDTDTGRLVRNVASIDPNTRSWRLIALSRDGRRLIGIAGADTKLWDTVTGREILSVTDDGPARDDTTDRMAMSDDGARIVVRHKDSVTVHDGATGSELTTVRAASAVALSRDGKTVAVGRRDRAVELVDATTGTHRGLTTLDATMAGAVWSQDGRSIAITSASGRVILWDLQANRQIAERRGKDAEAWFSRDGAHWAFADGHGRVKVLSTATGAVSATVTAPSHASLAGFSPDDARLVFVPRSDAPPRSDTADGWSVTMVSVATGETVDVFKGPDGGSLGSRYYVEQDGVGALRLRDIASWRSVRVIAGQQALEAAAFSMNGGRVALARHGGISVIDAETGRQIGGCPAAGTTASVAFSPDGALIAYGGADKTVTVCDPEQPTVTHSLTGHDGAIASVAFAADGRRVISGDETGTVGVWDVANGRRVRTFRDPDRRGARVVAFAPDGPRVVSGTDDNKIHTFNLVTGRPEQTLRMLTGPVAALAVSPDGRRVAAGSYREFGAKQWDVGTGKELAHLSTGTAGRFMTVADLRYGAAGDHLLAAICNNKLAAWDADSGRKKLDITWRDRDFKSVAFSGDGRRLVTVDEAGVIRHWDRPTGALMVTVTPLDGGAWLRLTPEGFFDASSPAVAATLSVVRGVDVAGVDGGPSGP